MLTETEKEAYMAAYEQKERLIELMKNGKINAEIYFKTLKKTVDSKSLPEDLQIIAEMEFEDWDTLHSKNTMDWFMDIVNESGEEYENVQTKKYQAYKKGKPIP